jgi:hypothetical protein
MSINNSWINFNPKKVSFIYVFVFGNIFNEFILKIQILTRGFKTLYLNAKRHSEISSQNNYRRCFHVICKWAFFMLLNMLPKKLWIKKKNHTSNTNHNHTYGERYWSEKVKYLLCANGAGKQRLRKCW